MGLADVAAASCKSNGTILRLCRKAGSSGWRAFRIDFMADLERALRTSRAIDPNIPFHGNASTQAILNAIAALKREALEDCYASIDGGQVQALADALVRSRRVIYYAMGDSYATASAFGAQASKLCVACLPADQFRFTNESAYHATAGDLALFVTYSGTLVPDYAAVQFETLHKRRCKIAIVTSLASAADKGQEPALREVCAEHEHHKAGVGAAQAVEGLHHDLGRLPREEEAEQADDHDDEHGIGHEQHQVAHLRDARLGEKAPAEQDEAHSHEQEHHDNLTRGDGHDLSHSRRPFPFPTDACR